MAAKVNLLKLFSTGQGIAGGIGNYVNYPADHDSNYTAIETTVNQITDEITAARLGDSQIPGDMLTSDEVTEGRYATEDAAISTSGDILTVSSGPIYVNGQKVLVVGDTFDMNGLATDTYYINVDANGLLNRSTVTGQAFFDICDIVWTTPTTFGTITDNLFNDGEVLNSIKHGYMQEPGNPPGVITDVTNVDYPGRLRPNLRYKSREGVLGATGIFAGADDILGITSALDGVSDTVLAATFNNEGQFDMFEQARFSLIATAAHSIPEDGTSSNNDVRWETLPATNVAGALERFEPESYTASTEWQGATGNVNCIIPSGFEGTWMISAWFEIDELTGGTYIEARLFQNGGVSTGSFAEVRYAPAPTGSTKVCLSGMWEAAAGDTFNLEVTHDATTAENILDGGLTAFRLGGAV